MIRLRVRLGLALLIATGLQLANAQTGFPYANESLGYSINWPSGLSLGEARLKATSSKAPEGAVNRWDFELTLDAAVPGFTISDRFHSAASGDLCSIEAEKEYAHGRRKSHEKTTFDQRRGVANRTTVNGGKTEIPISSCGRDALTFLFYSRRELAQGRVPPAQTILFGAPYQIRLEYTGLQTVSVNETRIQADRMTASLKGPASDLAFEMFFARDPARTPVLIRAPFPLGTFTMELVR